MPKKRQEDVYLVICKTQERANMWMQHFIAKYYSEVVSADRVRSRVTLSDSIYYFWSEARIASRGSDRAFRHATLIPEESVYIMLDDPERKRLDTYEGQEAPEDND